MQALLTRSERHYCHSVGRSDLAVAWSIGGESGIGVVREQKVRCAAREAQVPELPETAPQERDPRLIDHYRPHSTDSLSV